MMCVCVCVCNNYIRYNECVSDRESELRKVDFGNNKVLLLI